MNDFSDTRPRATPETIDRALVFCRGSFVAAAKLLDMCPSSFRGVIFRTPSLKIRWGHRKRGPGARVGFRIEPWQDNREFGSVGCIQDSISALPSDEKHQLLLWLKEQCSETIDSATTQIQVAPAIA